MKKILITGNAGSGKTTVGYHFSNILNKRLFHLDKIVWQPFWAVTPKKEKEEKFTEILKLDSWIVEGVSKIFLEEADTIIFLDYSRWTCYFRSLSRTGKYIFRSRPELPKNCPEIFAMSKLIRIIWNFPKHVRPIIIKHCLTNPSKNIYNIHSNKELINAYRDIAKRYRESIYKAKLSH